MTIAGLTQNDRNKQNENNIVLDVLPVLSSSYQQRSVLRFSCVQNRVSNQFQFFDHELHRYDNLLSRTRPRLETITFKYNMKTDVLYQKHCLHKGNEYIFREDNSVNLFLLPF